MSRAPLLADMLISPAAIKRSVVSPQTHEGLRSLLYKAKRFVLDREAALHVARALRDNPRFIADAHDFALAPFETMWVEFDYDEFYETISGQFSDENGDKRVGYLFAGANVYSASMRSDLDGGFYPIRMKRNQPMSVEQELDLCDRVGISRIGIDAFYWGSAFQKLKGDRDLEALRTLRAHHGFDFLPSRLPDTVLPQIMEGGNGDLRNAIALLIFLNRTSNIQSIEHVPMAHRMIHRAPAALLAHSIISLKIDPAPTILRLCAGEGIWRRLHDVRGHFCHNAAARNAKHEHEWQEVDEMRWRCSACDGLRWWKREHRRGHEDKGLVSSEYQVSA